MEYFIAALIIGLAIFIVGFMMRKKLYKEIDRLEAWKIDIMNRPVLDELTKVKQLNMTGQTEEMFERWRNQWDEIVTDCLPDIEEMLFDSEEFSEKFRFKKAKEIQGKIEDKLKTIEEKITNILSELNNLVGSEEKNRMEMEELKGTYRELKQQLLAHRHTFGKAVSMLEDQLEEVVQLFVQFEETTEQGNYLEAREIVLVIFNKLLALKAKMELIPKLIVECQTTLPNQLQEAYVGFKEMVEAGYILEHIEIEQEMDSLKNKLEGFIELIEKTEIDEVEKELNTVRSMIDHLYDLLEKEVHARRFVTKHEQETKEALLDLQSEHFRLVEETRLVQQTYHITNEEIEIQRSIDKQIAQLMKRYQILESQIESESIAHSILFEELEDIRSLLEQLDNEQKLIAEKLLTLRKDEIDAREKVNELLKKTGETTRIISRSNIPGLPLDYKYLLEDAKESITVVIQKLEEKPLDISTVQNYLDRSEHEVDKLLSTTMELVENVQLAEKIIQYGNRYRRRYPTVAKGLNDAEIAFRDYDYKTALEQAATAVESVEPGALKQIERLLEIEM